MTKTLLVVSADREADEAAVGRGAGPRRDYLALAEALDAAIFDFGTLRRSTAGSRLIRVFGKGPAQALLAAQRAGSYDTVFTDSEHIGLFLGILLARRRSRPRHVMLAHHLTPRKKHLFARLGRSGIDAVIVHSEAQRDFAVQRLGFEASRISVLPYQVDTDFWRPLAVQAPPMICTMGLECRDYATFLSAVEGLSVDVRIGAASNWSRKANTLAGRTVPSGVEVGSYGYEALREIYAEACLVAVPLLDVDFQAGVTLILEAMAMAKAVVATQTRGQAGAVQGPLWIDGTVDWPSDGPAPEQSTGIYVPPRRPDLLRDAMQYLLERPDLAARLGRNGRKAVVEAFTLEHFTFRFASAIDPGWNAVHRNQPAHAVPDLDAAIASG